MKFGCLLSVLLVALTICFFGCSEEVPAEGVTDEIIMTPPYGEDWVLELKAEGASATGTALVFTHSGDGVELMTGEPYTLEKYTDGEWQMLEPAKDLSFHLVGYNIPNNESYTLHTDWEYGYGALPEGHYRIGKNVSIKGMREGTYEGVKKIDYYTEDKVFYAEFDIEFAEKDYDGSLAYAAEYLNSLGIAPEISVNGTELTFTFTVSDEFEKCTADDARNEWEIYKMLRDNDAFAPFSLYGVYYVTESGEVKSGSGSSLPVSRPMGKGYPLYKTEGEIKAEIYGLIEDSQFSEYTIDNVEVDEPSVRVCVRETENVCAVYADLEYAYGLLRSYFEETGLVPVASFELYDKEGVCVAIVCGDLSCGVYKVWFEGRFNESFADMGYGPKE